MPKKMIGEIMDILADVKVTAPVSLGDVIVKDISGTGADIIATRAI